MLKIRLSRTGKKKQASYRIVVTDITAKRDGRIVERIGHYNPLVDPIEYSIDEGRALHWLSVGAQPTDAVERLLVKQGTVERLGRLHAGETLEALVAEFSGVEEAAEETEEAETEAEEVEEAAAEVEEAEEIVEEETVAEAEAKEEEAEAEAEAEEAEAEVEEEAEAETEEEAEEEEAAAEDDAAEETEEVETEEEASEETEEAETEEEAE